MASVACPPIANKSNASSLIDQKLTDELARQCGYRWREVKLGPGQTLHHFGWQILMGNVTCDAVGHHANGGFTAAAYCQARQRLPMEVLSAVSDRIIATLLARFKSPQSQWHGHRVFRIDGSSAMMPDSPALRAHFGCSSKQKPGCGYPTTHLLLLTGPGGVALDLICSPLRTGDMTHAAKTHLRLEPGDLLLGDGQFGGWGHLHHLSGQQLHGLFPAHHSRKIAWGRNGDHGCNRRFVRTLGYRDQLVEYRKPAKRPTWMTAGQFAAAPEWLLVRELQREVRVGGVRRKMIVVTTLLDPQAYPAKQVVRLLGERWLIETQLRSMKTTMGMERLRCQTVEGVRKELLMYMIVYNLVRLLILEAAERQKVPPERISFADALARLRHGSAQVAWVDLEVVPLRPDRVEPRVVKRRPKAYPFMTKPRQVLREQIRRDRKTVKALA
jgi:hypothetical protein